LLAPVLDQVVKDANIDKALVNDICVGNVLMPSCGGMRNRMAQFIAWVLQYLKKMSYLWGWP